MLTFTVTCTRPPKRERKDRPIKSGAIYQWAFFAVIFGIGFLVGFAIPYPETSELTNEEVVELYIANEAEISVLWVEMTERGIDASMGDAVKEWLRRKGK